MFGNLSDQRQSSALVSGSLVFPSGRDDAWDNGRDDAWSIPGITDIALNIKTLGIGDGAERRFAQKQMGPGSKMAVDGTGIHGDEQWLTYPAAQLIPLATTLNNDGSLKWGTQSAGAVAGLLSAFVSVKSMFKLTQTIQPTWDVIETWDVNDVDSNGSATELISLSLSDQDTVKDGHVIEKQPCLPSGNSYYLLDFRRLLRAMVVACHDLGAASFR